MYKLKNGKIVSLLFSSLLCLSLMGCGNQSTEVDDYGSNTSLETNTEVETNTEKADAESEAGESSSESLSTMLGGTNLAYNNSFDLENKHITVDVNYNIESIESLSEYLVESVHEAQFDEQQIVEGFFGDTAVPFSKDDTLNQENGDSIYPIMASQMIEFNNNNSGNDATSWGSTGNAWVDEGAYYIHTYNGTYRNADYQLLVSYSQNTSELVVVLFPKNIGEVTNDPSYEYMDFSGPDGKYYSYYQNKMKAYTIDELLPPNKCSMSDDQVISTASTSIKDAIGIEYPGESLSMRSNLYELVSTYSGNLQKCEILYFPESALATDGFEGAERNGYALSVLGNLDNIKVMTNTTNTINSAAMFNNGMVGIDDEGILALYITSKYSFKEKTVENVKVLSFKDAMDSFVKEAPENLDLSMEKRVDNNVTFNWIQLVYFPIPKEGSTSEYKLVPAWSLDTTNSSGEPIARVLINAEDGSYITTLFKPVDE